MNKHPICNAIRNPVTKDHVMTQEKKDVSGHRSTNTLFKRYIPCLFQFKNRMLTINFSHLGNEMMGTNFLHQTHVTCLTENKGHVCVPVIMGETLQKLRRWPHPPASTQTRAACPGDFALGRSRPHSFTARPGLICSRDRIQCPRPGHVACTGCGIHYLALHEKSLPLPL